MSLRKDMLLILNSFRYIALADEAPIRMRRYRRLNAFGSGFLLDVEPLEVSLVAFLMLAPLKLHVSVLSIGQEYGLAVHDTLSVGREERDLKGWSLEEHVPRVIRLRVGGGVWLRGI
jgi:hypothetical protein